jgi:antitoxin PrlF
MSASVISTRGQIVIPARIREDLRLKPGSRVDFVKTEEGWLIKPAKFPATALKGVLGKPHKPIPVEYMNRAIRHRVRRQWLDQFQK